MLYYIEREEDAKRRRAHHLEKGGAPLGENKISKCGQPPLLKLQ
jgi:hypothetical protein